jgi:hypothetical protein
MILMPASLSHAFLTLCLALAVFLGSGANRAAAVPTIVRSGETYARIKADTYCLELGHPGNGLIITVADPPAQGICLRNYYAQDQTALLFPLDKVSAREDAGHITLTGKKKSRYGTAILVLVMDKAEPATIGWQVSMNVVMPLALGDSTFNWRYFGELTPELVPGYLAAPLSNSLFFIDRNVLKRQVLLLEDYSSLNEYFRIGNVSPESAVRMERAAFGYRMPGKRAAYIPSGANLILDKGWLCFKPDDGAALDDFVIASSFLSLLGRVYPRLQKPEPVVTDWLDVASRAIQSLEEPECCSESVGGARYLYPYVRPSRTRTTKSTSQAELMTQMLIATGLKEYSEFSQKKSRFLEDLLKGLPNFYAKDTKILYNEVVSDPPVIAYIPNSWYYVLNLVHVGQLARAGHQEARTIFKDAFPRFREVAEKLNYEFPSRFNFQTGEILDQRAYGWQYDNAGAYAYGALLYLELFKDPRYLEEAKKAISHLLGKGTRLSHEFPITALGVTAAGWLYKITGDDYYLRLAKVPLAILISQCWLWNCDYGYAEDGYQTFFGMTATSGNNIIAPMEQVEVWLCLREFLELTAGKLDRETGMICSEFVKYTPSVLRYAYPQFLPKDAIFAGSPSYPVSTDYWIAVEDLQEGYSKSGQIGQAIYQSGAALHFAGRCYYRAGREATLYSPLPIKIEPLADDRFLLRIYSGGDTASAAQVFPAKDRYPILVANSSRLVNPRASGGGPYEFLLVAGQKYEMFVLPAQEVSRLAAEAGMAEKWLKDHGIPRVDIHRFCGAVRFFASGMRMRFAPQYGCFGPPGSVVPFAMTVTSEKPLDGSTVYELFQGRPTPVRKANVAEARRDVIFDLALPSGLSPGLDAMLPLTLKVKSADGAVYEAWELIKVKVRPPFTVCPVANGLVGISPEGRSALNFVFRNAQATTQTVSLRAGNTAELRIQNRSPDRVCTTPPHQSLTETLEFTFNDAQRQGREDLSIEFLIAPMNTMISAVVPFIHTQRTTAFAHTFRHGMEGWAEGSPPCRFWLEDGKLVLVPSPEHWGGIAQSFYINFDAHPTLEVTVNKTDGQWAIFLHDLELETGQALKTHRLQADTSAVGTLSYNLPLMTGLSGIHNIRISIYSVGKSNVTRLWLERVSLTEH